MFEAFKVGITIALTNTVSTALMAMSKDFAKTDAAAMKLRGTLNQIKVLGTLGIVSGALGFAGLKLIEGAVKPAEEYAHQLNIMNMAGMKQADIAQAVGAAWKNTSVVMTTTATENLKSILDLKNILGNMDEAKALLPIVTKIQTVMAASGDSRLAQNAHDIAFSMAKALDVIGAVRNPAEMQKQAEMMSKVISAFQGRVTPQMFQSVFTYARQAKFDLSDEFKYEILPSMMLEFANKGGGGGSRGVGPMLAAMYRITNQGYVNRKAVPELESLGLLNASTVLSTTTSGTTAGHLKDAALAAANPFRWVNEVLVPAIRKKYGEGVTDEFVRQKINEVMRGNQLAASMAVEFFTKQNNFLRDQKIIQGALPFNEAYNSAINRDPYTAMRAFDAQWESFKTALGKDLVPVIIPAILATARALNYLTGIAVRHPAFVQGMMVFVATLSGLLMLGGLLLTGAAALLGFKLALAALGPVFMIGGGWLALIVLGISAFVAGAYLVYTHWGRIKNGLAEIWQGIIGFLNNLVNGLRGLIGQGSVVGSGIQIAGHALLGSITPSSDYGVTGIATAPSVAAPPFSKSITLNSNLNLDGRVIGQSTSQFLYDGMNVAPASGSGFDGRLSYSPSSP